MKDGIRHKTIDFALRIINLSKYLQNERYEYVLSKQILRSGTSIGANVAESQDAQSALDFISKLQIALKEARETEYWLLLISKSDYISQNMWTSMRNDLNEIISLLVSIIKSKKSNILNRKSNK